MFIIRQWLDRLVQYPARRKLVGTADPFVYDVSREEGIVIQEGDKITAESMNDLEGRIAAGFADIPVVEAYPVGSYYFSDNITNPFELFGYGEWVRSKGRFLVGLDEADATFSTIGATGGGKTVTLAVANLPGHTHSIPALSGSAASAGAHTHTSAAHTHSIPVLYGTTSAIGNHNHGVGSRGNNNLAAGGQAVGQEFLGNAVFNLYWTNGAGEHYHSLSTSASTTGSTTPGATGSSGAHTHTVTTTANNTGSTGSAQAITTLPPFEVVVIWKRVA